MNLLDQFALNFVVIIICSSHSFVELYSFTHNIRLLESLGPRHNNNPSKTDRHVQIHKNARESTERLVRKRKAKYSPDIFLLTSYDPLANLSGNSSMNYNNKTTGSTVELNLSNAKNVTFHKVLKSGSEAVKLHDDMMLESPNDGMVRVRMYFHQAIHDDPKQYGTGPWNYWGHGWGYEYGFDPEDYDRRRYQRGYTIEKAYGRDFCQNRTNCRREDPKFFEKARKYSPDMPNFIKDTGERLTRFSNGHEEPSKTPDEILALLWKRIPI